MLLKHNEKTKISGHIGHKLNSALGDQQGVFCHWAQEKETCALLFLGEGNRCTTVLRKMNLVQHCFQEKETIALLFLEGIWCSTVLRKRVLVLYCSWEKGDEIYVHFLYVLVLIDL